MCPNLTEQLGLCWDQNSQMMISYWLFKIVGVSTFGFGLYGLVRYAPEILKSLYPFFEKILDHRLDWRKEANHMKIWESENQNDPKKKRRPPS